MAVVTAVEDLSAAAPGDDGRTPLELLRSLDQEPGRFDPSVVMATRAAVDKHGWQAAAPSGAGT